MIPLEKSTTNILMVLLAPYLIAITTAALIETYGKVLGHIVDGGAVGVVGKEDPVGG